MSKFDPREAGFHYQARDGKEWQFVIENESLKLLKQSGFELHLCGMGPERVAVKLEKRSGILLPGVGRG